MRDYGKRTFMTLSYKVKAAGPAGSEVKRGPAAPALLLNGKPHEAAPALFRLLADSALYRAAFDCCGYPMAIVDAVTAGCPVVQVNPAFERSFGIPDVEARGKPFSAALCRGDHTAAQKLFASSGVQAALLVWCKDGTQLQVETSLGPVYDVKGTRTHWVVTFARQEAAERSVPHSASTLATRA